MEFFCSSSHVIFIIIIAFLYQGIKFCITFLFLYMSYIFSRMTQAVVIQCIYAFKN